MKLNPIYKKLLLLAIVFGPIFGLVFSEDGQRRADLVLISILKDTEDMNIAFGKLQENVLEADIRGNFPAVPFECKDHVSQFGDRVCASTIASFNGAPASYAAIFFRGGRLSAVKMTYHPHYHTYVERTLRTELGAPEPATDGAVWRWDTDYGAVFFSVNPPAKDDEPTVIWFSDRRIARPTDAG